MEHGNCLWQALKLTMAGGHICLTPASAGRYANTMISESEET